MRMMNLCVDGDVVGVAIKFDNGACLVHHHTLRFVSEDEMRCYFDGVVSVEERQPDESAAVFSIVN